MRGSYKSEPDGINGQMSNFDGLSWVLQTGDENEVDELIVGADVLSHLRFGILPLSPAMQIVNPRFK